MAFIRALPRLEPPPVLTGRDVMLRYPVLGDFDAWARLREASRDFLKPWEPTWPADDLTRPAFRRRLRRYSREIRGDVGYPFFIFERTGGRLVGGCTLSNVRRGVAQACSLGYWMGAPFAGQGLMRDAVTALTPFVFRRLGLHRIEAACLPENDRSRRLLTRVGFREEGYARAYLRIDGLWRDHVLYALLEGDLGPAGPG